MVLETEVLKDVLNDKLVEKAIRTLYRKGDVVEVRAWDKNHEIFTGRYTRSRQLIDVVKIFNEGGCDVYLVLNPVGDKLGHRDMSAGGLCTWEQDVPHRRFFLLDFDPVRSNKIATEEEFDAAHAAAKAAMQWLQSYGWRGIILASSGNGCHLLLPCDLPNNAESKTMVLKVQRIVSEKFSTPAVEIECFPDANRLVRAYGTVNHKGEESDGRKHRMSAILEVDNGPCDAVKIMETLIASFPITLNVAKQHADGEGEGAFSRDILFERLQAWKEQWEGKNGEQFTFEETDRKDGFRVWCPGNFPDGWSDGEAHSENYSDVNDSSICWVENGWPRFRCSHAHCDEGAEHGKKTWKHLQEFYDPQRKFHKIIDETDYSTKWELDYVDDGIADKGDADVNELVNTETVTLEPQTVETPEAGRGEEVTTAPKRKLHEIPEAAMYGWLAKKARELQTPMGFAYPAMLTAFAGTIKTFPKQVRPTLYTALVGAVHCGKSETVKRAIASLDWLEPEAVKWTVPGSDRGLINIFGLMPKKKKNGEPEDDMGLRFAKTKLLAQDELKTTFAKAAIQGSALPSTMCQLWSQDDAGSSDKTGVHDCLVRLNILGALKADDTDDFAEAFSKESTAGLYDRFVLGIGGKGWRFNYWEPKPELRLPSNPTITPECFQMLSAWRDENTEMRGRLGEIALRIAYITAAANGDTEVGNECMTAALEFATWQETIRYGYKAGLSDALDAQCTNSILSILEKVEPGKWVRWRDIASAKNWYRKYGARVLTSCRDALAKSGATIEETVEDENGRPKRTGRLRLRGDKETE